MGRKEGEVIFLASFYPHCEEGRGPIRAEVYMLGARFRIVIIKPKTLWDAILSQSPRFSFYFSFS